VPEFDLFVSYRRKDTERVLPLVDALRKRGLSVWLDQNEIGEFAPITDEIRHGLAQSKALLAWYSEKYPQSRPCQMELTAALLAAQQKGDPRRRILVINPEAAASHIQPLELRDAQYAVAPSDSATYAALAERVATHVGTFSEPLGGVLPTAPPPQYGLRLTGSTRFVGRLPDLWRINSALHRGESAIISGTTASGLAIVSGFGGVGKSLLVEEYALRFGAAYPGGIFWLRAFGNDPSHGPEATGHEAVRLEQFVAVAVALGIEVKGLDPRQVEAQLNARFSASRQPFLWIVDDLASRLEANAVKAWLAPAPLGKTLFTTRSREYGAIGTPVPLDVLTPQEAFDLLCSQRTPSDSLEKTAAEDITRDLGCHALAVDVAAAALAAMAGVMSFVQFRADLSNPNEDELELAADLADVLPSGHEKGVSSTILRSIRSLPEEGQDFLRLAALLAVAPIPPLFAVATFLQVDNLADADAKRRVVLGQRQVEQVSLAERGELDAMRVHTLVSRAVRFHEVKPERREAVRAAAVIAFTNALSEIATPGPTALALEVQHARALLGPGDLLDPHARDLAELVALLDYRRGSYLAARPLLERVFEAQRRVLGEDDSHTLTSMNTLAHILLALRDLTGARGLQERLLEAVRRVRGEDDLYTLGSMMNLATILEAQGDLAGARELHERVLQALRLMLGEDHPHTLGSMMNLAQILGKQGDLSAARGWQERVFEVQRLVLGEDHPVTLLVMNNLALTKRAQGDLIGAKEMQERVFAAQRRVLGEDHAHTLASMSNIANTLQQQGDLDTAREWQERALEARRRVLGENHPDTLVSMSDLAEIVRQQGDLAAARRWHESALEVRRRVLGEDHPDTLTSINNLAVTLEAQGDLDGASRLRKRVLAAQR
jgi:tetratricopeptide (TPR) repeat protein